MTAGRQDRVYLYAYAYSVYSWIARLALAIAKVDYCYREVNPFADNVSTAYLALNPWRRVPTLVHNDICITETVAITGYINDQFNHSRLLPTDPAKRARMYQIIATVDQYGYWPMVRQVFSHGYFRKAEGETADQDELRSGLEKSRLVLSFLEPLIEIESESSTAPLTLADIHLGPMVHYLCRNVEGAKLLETYPNLSEWYRRLSEFPEFAQTQPTLP